MTPAGAREGRRRRLLPLALLAAATACVGATVGWTLVAGGDASPADGDDAAEVVAAPHLTGSRPITAATVAPTSLSRGIGVALPEPPAPADAGDAAPAAATASSARAWGPGDVDAYCASPGTPVGASSARGLLDAANAERARLGIAPLRWSDELAAASLAWSASMADADESTPGMADALAHSPSPAGAAENVGVAASSTGLTQAQAARTLAHGWMRSPGHCRAIMNPGYTAMGAGLASTGDGTTWYGTQSFR